MSLYSRPGGSRRWFASPTARYLAAHFAKSQLWHASTLLFGFFLTEACGLNVTAMGFVMAASLAFNGAIDAALGWYWQRRGVRPADALRFQARGAPLTCLFFLSFCATPLIGQDNRLAWALAMLLGFRVSYPFIDVPQNALVALAMPVGGTRCGLLAKRNVASGLAALSVGMVAAPLLIHQRDVAVWLLWAGGLAMLACGTAWQLGRTAMIDAEDAPAGDVEPMPPMPFAALLLLLAAMMTATATFRTLEPYHAAFAGRGSGLMLWAAIGGLVSQPLWLIARRRFSHIAMMALAALLSGIAAIGLSRGTPFGIVLAGIGFGISTGGLWLTLWTGMMVHAAAGNATGYVGTFTCVSKLAQAAAMLLLTRVIATSAYRDTLADPLSPPSLLMLGALVAIAAVALALGGMSMAGRSLGFGMWKPRFARGHGPNPDRL